MDVITFNGENYGLQLVTDEYHMGLLYADLAAYQDIALDLETEGLHWFGGDKLIGIAVYFIKPRRAYYIPFRHKEGDNRPIQELEDLKGTLLRRDTIYGWNLKFDMHFLKQEGFTFHQGTVWMDGMVMLHMLDENRYTKGLNYKLKDVARQYIAPDAADADLELHKELHKRNKKKGEMSWLPAHMVGRYAMFDVILSWELCDYFLPFIKLWHQEALLDELCEYLVVLMEIEHNGLHIDTDLTQQHIDETNLMAVKTLEAIREIAGQDFNPNSPQQVAKALGSTDARRTTLEAMDNPLAKLVVQFKYLHKAVGTFYQPYLELGLADVNRNVHPNLNIIGTVSGRLSASNPNPQQLPRKSEQYRVKQIFVAPEGYSVVQCDYKAQELRLAAHFAKEHAITRAFNEGRDPHQMTADSIGISRQTGKTLNFGLLYGMGVQKAATFLGIPEDEARKLVPMWHSLYPAFRAMHSRIIALAMQHRNRDGGKAANEKDAYNYIRLEDGRIRHYEGADAPYFSSWNTLIQGTGAIIMRRALIRLYNYFRLDPDVIIAMTVHDSVVMYIKNERLDEVLPIVKRLMEDFPQYNPRMEVEIAVGNDWYSVKELK